MFNLLGRLYYNLSLLSISNMGCFIGNHNPQKDSFTSRLQLKRLSIQKRLPTKDASLQEIFLELKQCQALQITNLSVSQRIDIFEDKLIFYTEQSQIKTEKLAITKALVSILVKASENGKVSAMIYEPKEESLVNLKYVFQAIGIALIVFDQKQQVSSLNKIYLIWQGNMVNDLLRKCQQKFTDYFENIASFKHFG